MHFTSLIAELVQSSNRWKAPPKYDHFSVRHEDHSETSCKRVGECSEAHSSFVSRLLTDLA